MSEIGQLSDAEESFLQAYLPRTASNVTGHAEDVPQPSVVEPVLGGQIASRPFVTLTYACSLDSMISLAPGVRTTLSGPETKCMTHYLRLHHDSILVGVGTAIVDDPSLNCRYANATFESQPQPVVIDPTMRWDVANSRASQLAREEIGKPPWIVQTTQVLNSEHGSRSGYERIVIDDIFSQATVSDQVQVHDSPRKIDWNNILKALKQRGIDSVMIEGGATIINQLLSLPDLVDTVIITIAPTFLGQGGTSVSPAPKIEDGQRTNAIHLEKPTWRQFGGDVVLCGKLTK